METVNQSTTQEVQARKRRGFACMDRERVREIGRRGGQAAHAGGRAHEFTSEEARVAGRKGGYATQRERRKVYEEYLRDELGPGGE
jgi:general stress protein YciG